MIPGPGDADEIHQENQFQQFLVPGYLQCHLKSKNNRQESNDSKDLKHKIVLTHAELMLRITFSLYYINFFLIHFFLSLKLLFYTAPKNNSLI